MDEPLTIWTEDVREEWIDYNGHLSEAYYVLVLGHATDEVMAAVGLGPAYREHTGASLFTVEAHVRYVDQVGRGEALEVRSWVVGATPKLLWIWHELWAAGTLRATEEILGVHVGGRTPGGPTAVPFPDEVRTRIDAVLVPPGPDASRVIRLGTARPVTES
jgi:acyl-CoA thioester hydrolase